MISQKLMQQPGGTAHHSNKNRRQFNSTSLFSHCLFSIYHLLLDQTYVFSKLLLVAGTQGTLRMWLHHGGKSTIALAESTYFAQQALRDGPRPIYVLYRHVTGIPLIKLHRLSVPLLYNLFTRKLPTRSKPPFGEGVDVEISAKDGVKRCRRQG